MAGCLWSACPTLEHKRAEVAGFGGELEGDLGRGCRVQQEREGKGVRRFRKVPIEQLSGSSGA